MIQLPCARANLYVLIYSVHMHTACIYTHAYIASCPFTWVSAVHSVSFIRFSSCDIGTFKENLLTYESCTNVNEYLVLKTSRTRDNANKCNMRNYYKILHFASYVRVHACVFSLCLSCVRACVR